MSMRMQLLGLAGLSCVARSPAPSPARQGAEPAPAAAADPHVVATPTALAAPAPHTTHVLLREPALLAALEREALALGPIAFGSDARDNAALRELADYRAIVDVLARDLDAIANADAKAGVGLRHGHRLFDRRWLSSPRASFELVAVVNRLDREPFAPQHCGETRLIYRLAQQERRGGEEIRSRLPMTLNVVFWQPRGADGCAAVARSWQLPPEQSPQALLDPGRPLHAAQLSAAQLHGIEVALQTERWPSTLRPALGGHAGYVRRVFGRAPVRGGLVPLPLENTPDVRAIRAGRGGVDLDALREHIAEPAALDAIDRGTFALPEAYLATASHSFAPRGLARPGNRPSRSCCASRSWPRCRCRGARTSARPRRCCAGSTSSAAPAATRAAASPASTCWATSPTTARVDALAVGVSPHLLADLPRRVAFVQATADGRCRPSRARPPTAARAASASAAAWATSASPTSRVRPGCSAPRSTTQSWVCLPPEPQAGSPCEVGTLRGHPDPHRDRARAQHVLACGDGACNDNRVGFPQGTCVRACSGLGPHEACGGVPQLDPFNACLSTGRAFAACVRASAQPAGLRACDEARPCRDDYVCARAGDHGVCMPPYFLYQLRVDGHPG
ncbi:MAG: hypothetical protein U0168_28940 [Nannocystaceae bacterium]